MPFTNTSREPKYSNEALHTNTPKVGFLLNLNALLKYHFSRDNLSPYMNV